MFTNFPNKHAIDSKQKKKMMKRMMIKIKNPFASSSKRNPNWSHVPENSVAEEESDLRAKLHHCSIRALATSSSSEQSELVDSLAFIDNDLSDWLELDSNGAASPRSVKDNSSHHRRSEFSTHYNANGSNDEDDNESTSEISFVSAMTQSSETKERGCGVDDDALAAIYLGIALGDNTHTEMINDGEQTLVKIHDAMDLDDSYDPRRSQFTADTFDCGGDTDISKPLMAKRGGNNRDPRRSQITADTFDTFDTFDYGDDTVISKPLMKRGEPTKSNNNSVVSVVHTAMQRSLRAGRSIVVSDHRRRPQWRRLSSLTTASQ